MQSWVLFSVTPVKIWALADYGVVWSVIVPVAWPLTDRLNRWSPSTGGGNEFGLSSPRLSAPSNTRLVSSSTYLGHLTVPDVTSANAVCVCVRERETFQNFRMIYCSMISLNPNKLDSLSGWSDVLKQQSQLNIQGLTFFRLFVTVNRAAFSYQDQQRPWQSDIVTNDGYDPPWANVWKT